MHHPLALRHSRSALAANYRALTERAGVPAGAAIKADGYGLGAKDVAKVLLEEGCRDFFVSTWWEAGELPDLPPGSLAVLHGVGPDDVPTPNARPVLVSAAQIMRWKLSSSRSEPCDVMIDTGMNRLGLSLDDLACLDGLSIHTLHSHLACADEAHSLNSEQLQRFEEVRRAVPAKRYSLANSAGIYLGRQYSFDLVRPGLALYGGIPRAEARGEIVQVMSPRAQVLQVRDVRPGESVGYNATFRAEKSLRAAIINIGYADGYRRAFSSIGAATFNGCTLPVVGRVSMDLVTLDATEAPELSEGDWVDLCYDLERASEISQISQYELLTGLGRRFRRFWT